MDLIKVNDEGQCTARELYEFLELNPAHFARWAKSNIVDNGFAEENVDYLRITYDGETPTGGIVKRDDYMLKPEFAKKLCMTSQTSKGEVARNYFIEVEKKFKAATQIPQTMSQALLLAYQQSLVIEEQAASIAIAAPKVEYFDTLIDRGLSLSFRNTAKELLIPERKFIAWLEECKYIYRSGKAIHPYAKYVPRYFEIKEYAVGKSVGVQTLVTVEGRNKFIGMVIA